jgi:hypothetical protein
MTACDTCGAELPLTEEHHCRVMRDGTLIITRFIPRALIPPPPTLADLEIAAPWMAEVCTVCGASPVLAHLPGSPAYCIEHHPEPDANLERHGK